MPILLEDTIDFDTYLQDTEPAEKVRPASDYLNDVMHVLSPAHDTPQHPKLPFANSWVYFAPGELTLWAGFNNSGKSAIQGQVLTELAKTGSRVCIASMEMKPAKTIARIARQEFRCANPTRDQVSFLLKQTHEHLWIYDQQGTVRTNRIVAVIKHCAEKLKISHIAIDSLMKCVAGTDNYNEQKDFVDTLTACARDYNVHIHLVVHLKKGDGDERMPNRYDISGTAAISDLADNVLLVWRNKKKERDRDAGRAYDEEDPDSVLICDKQRNGDWEGRVKLWYDRNSLRFSDYNHDARRGLARAL